MIKLLSNLDELHVYIRNRDLEIYNNINPDEKKAALAIQDITEIANASTRAIYRILKDRVILFYFQIKTKFFFNM
ncbi:hypothetical protein bsdcttw_10270 [Anaerocolumna chitinilytica]|uniref:Uncharacterized protein n=1 Tax=Anaerocolumna chitinilytica TaxID=1727145 RepID=A0A7I8DNX1_9FIRM|nr:hypothetical protein bsdcttw_10270 [Anaerocolumna chitinilytica]